MANCRLCGAKIRKFLDLGKTPLPEEFRASRQLRDKIFYYPLNLVYCLSCGHVQLGYIVPQDLIYKKNYFYDYSVTETGLVHWKKLAGLILKKYLTDKNGLVVDIGSNTGMLLSIFKKSGAKVLGIDPATKIVKIARARGIESIDAYFSEETAKKVLKKYGKAKIITSTNTFDHIQNLKSFMDGIKILLSGDGLFIVEVPYFKTMLINLSHTVYHQQTDYMMIKPLADFLAKWGLEVFDVEEVGMHGGSVRIFIGFLGCHKISASVKSFTGSEEKLYRTWSKRLSKFATAVLRQRDDLVKKVSVLKKKGLSVAAVGASAKGHNLLNYCRLDSKSIDFITEKSALKTSLFTPSGIPIVPDEELLTKKPDYAILLAWNFKDEVFKNLSGYLAAGGKFIVPIPKLEIIDEA